MKLSKLHLVLAVTFVVGLVAGMAFVQAVNASHPQKTLEQQYKEAIERAMTGAQGVTSTGLNPINESNPRLIWNQSGPSKGVLVVTWTKHPSSYTPGQEVTLTWGEVWVTVVPDMREFFAAHVSRSSNLTLRAEQLLGGPVEWNYTYFVEMYVQPADLYRPAGDNEIDDTTASLHLPNDAAPWYREWFNANIIYSYYPEKYPWTRLGYTYDWGSPSHVGLSEYVVEKGATVFVRSVTPNAEYINGFYENAAS